MPITREEIGRRLKMLRESLGFTQKHVADQLGLHRPTISEIEAGRRDVSSAELFEFGRLYVTSLSELLADPVPTTDQTAEVLFRRPSLETPAARVAVKKFMQRCRDERELESLLEIEPQASGRPSYEVRMPTTKREAVRQGEDMARRERKTLQIGEEPLRNPLDLLEQQGVRIAPLEDGDGADVDGIYFESDELGACVAVNLRRDDRTGFRAAFTAAHEYAHWVLRDVRVEEFDFATTSGDDLREVRANAFAAGFLMPEHGLRAYFANLGLLRDNRVEHLSIADTVRAMDYFGVSRQALLYRLQNLNLMASAKAEVLRSLPLSFRQLTRLARQLGLRLRRQEYRSTRLPALAIEAWRRGLIGTGRAADLLDLDIAGFRTLMAEYGEEQESGDADHIVGAAAAG